MNYILQKKEENRITSKSSVKISTTIVSMYKQNILVAIFIEYFIILLLI